MRALSVAALITATLSVVSGALPYTPVTVDDVSPIRGKVVHSKEIDTNEINDDSRNSTLIDSFKSPVKPQWRDLDDVKDDHPIFRSFANLTFVVSLEDVTFKRKGYDNPFLLLDSELKAQNATWNRTDEYYIPGHTVITRLKLGGPSDVKKLRKVTNVRFIDVSSESVVMDEIYSEADAIEDSEPYDLKPWSFDSKPDESDSPLSDEIIGEPFEEPFENETEGSEIAFKPVYEGLVELCKKVQVLAPPTYEPPHPKNRPDSL